MAITDKSLLYLPLSPHDDKDYLAIRTREGALVSHKGEIKGLHKDASYSPL